MGRRASWFGQPAAVQAGEHQILLTVSDGQLTASENLMLVASYQPVAPVVHIELTPSFSVTPGQSVLIHVTASGIADIKTMSLAIEGQTVALDAFGRARYVPGQPGHVILTAAAEGCGWRDRRNRAGFEGARSQRCRCAGLWSQFGQRRRYFPNSPMSSARSRTPTWTTLELALLGSDNYTTLAGAFTPVQNQALASLDPASLPNGSYTLRLTATDIGGRTTQTSRVLEINTAAKTSAYTNYVTDLSVTLARRAHRHQPILQQPGCECERHVRLRLAMGGPRNPRGRQSRTHRSGGRGRVQCVPARNPRLSQPA